LLLGGFERARLRHRDLAGPGGRVGLEAAGAVVDVAEDDLKHPGDRDGQQRAQEAGQLDADEDADQHGERGPLHRPRHDDRLQDVGFELLVDDEDHQHHDRGGSECSAATATATTAPASRRPGDQVGEADEQGDDPREARPSSTARPS
jgi:hypothetical protein